MARAVPRAERTPARRGNPKVPPRRVLGALVWRPLPAHSARVARGGRTLGVPMKNEPTVPFVVGRLGKGDKTMVVLDKATPPPIPGPWDLRAVFSR